MKKDDLYFLVNEIDDKLISEAMEEALSGSGKPKKRKIFFSALSAAAIFALVIGLSSYGESFTLKPSVVTNEKTAETKETQKTKEETTLFFEETKPSEPTTERQKENETQRNTTAAVSEKETTTDFTQRDTTISVTVTEKPTEPTTQKIPPKDYYSYSFEYWKNSPDVVWGKEAIKGNARNQEIISLGSIKITELLKKLMQSGDDKTVYAVQVGFSSCAEKEFENWKYDGTTFAELKKGYNKNKMTDEEIVDYKTKIWEMKYAFCKQKIESFKDTFNKAGLEIHILERNVADCFFYVFATKAQIQSINPKSTEAFVLYPAEQMK